MFRTQGARNEYGGEEGGTETEDAWLTMANAVDCSGYDNVIKTNEPRGKRPSDTHIGLRRMFQRNRYIGLRHAVVSYFFLDVYFKLRTIFKPLIIQKIYTQ